MTNLPVEPLASITVASAVLHSSKPEQAKQIERIGFMAAFKQLARTIHVRVLCLQKFGVPPEGARASAGIHHRALVHFLSHVNVAQRVRQPEEDAVVAAVLERVSDMYTHVTKLIPKSIWICGDAPHPLGVNL
jgi:hypothetical protein